MSSTTTKYTHLERLVRQRAANKASIELLESLLTKVDINELDRINNYITYLERVIKER